MRTSELVLPLLFAVSFARGQDLEIRKTVFLVASGRDNALISTSLRQPATVISWESPGPDAVRSLRGYLNDPGRFPRGQTTVVLVGKLSAEHRTAILGACRALGLEMIERDARDVAASHGPSRVAWYASEEHRGAAEYWAFRAEEIHGVPYVVLGRPDDYRELASRGALLPSVVDFGGGFVRQMAGELPEAAIPAPAMELHSVQAVNAELLHLFRQYQRHRGAMATTPVHVVLSSGNVAVGILGTDPLAFYSSTSIATQYTNAICYGPEPCRPNALYQVLSFRTQPAFTQNCPATPGLSCERPMLDAVYHPETQGYTCQFSTNGQDDTNHVDAAIEAAADQVFGAIRPDPVSNVTIVSHWLDIPYRKRFFPFFPSFNWGEQGYPPHGKGYKNDPVTNASLFPCVRDLDPNMNDSDNDSGLGCGSVIPGYYDGQNFATTGSASGGCADPKRDPDGNDSHHDGETGIWDYFLANYWQDAATGDPYPYAHAAYGRILGDDGSQADMLRETAEDYISCRTQCSDDATCPAYCAPSGASGVLSQGPQNHVDSTPYHEWLSARYGGLANVATPCDPNGGSAVMRCPSDNPKCVNGPDEYSVATLLESAAITGDGRGEMVFAWGHNTMYVMGPQGVQFKRTGLGTCAGDPPILSTDEIESWDMNMGRRFPPGVWTIAGSNTMTFGFGEPCYGGGSGASFPRHPCYDDATGTCPASCMRLMNSSLVSSLVPRGVLALFAVPSHGTTRMTHYNHDLWARLVSRGIPLGEANRQVTNAYRSRAEIIESYEFCMAYGNPTANNGCFNAPTPCNPQCRQRVLNIPTLFLGDPVVSLPPPVQLMQDRPALLVGTGVSPNLRQGQPHVTGYGPYGDELRFALDFHAVSDVNSPAEQTYTYGATIGSGDLDAATLDGSDEIVVGRGPNSSCDTRVRVFSTFSNNPVPSAEFVAFPPASGSEDHYGVNIAVGAVRDTTGPDEIVVGRGPGPGSPFSPKVRVFKSTNGGGSWLADMSFDAYGAGVYYGVNVATGNFDADGLDEIVTGKGFGPGYEQRVKVFDGDGAPPTGYKFMLPAAAPDTYGATVGTALLDGDSVHEILVGKGPGAPGGPLGSGRDQIIDVWALVLGSFQLKVSFDAFRTDPVMYPEQGDYRAGAHAVGCQKDGLPGGPESIAVARGPSPQEDTGVNAPLFPGFRNGRVVVWDVDTSGGAWLATQDMQFTIVPYGSGAAQAGDYAGGASLSAIKSGPLSLPFAGGGQ